MRVLAEKRRERGEVAQAEVVQYLTMDTDELLSQICSPIPSSRTCAAIALGNHKVPKVVAGLCQQLKIEKKLYCKIAISDSLVNIGSLSIQPLLALLGKIGRNQETMIPHKGFNKISYPLPRDIVARILCRMNADILPELFEFLEHNELPFELEQAIDVIGHILYTEKRSINSKILIQISDKYSEFPMIQFKITRCLSGFTDDQAKHYLHNKLKSPNIGLQFEAARSLVLSGLYFPIEDYKLPEEVLVFIRQLNKKIQRTQKSRAADLSVIHGLNHAKKYELYAYN